MFVQGILTYFIKLTFKLTRERDEGEGQGKVLAINKMMEGLGHFFGRAIAIN